MLILDKGRALQTIVTRTLPDPDPEPLPDVFRLLSVVATPASFGLALDPYVAVVDTLNQPGATSTGPAVKREVVVIAGVR